jgi:predicted RNA-binding Zn ribbon-like protein
MGAGGGYDFTSEELEAAAASVQKPANKVTEVERRDRELIARHLRAAASAVNITDWPAYLRSVADGHKSGTSWYRP